VGALSSQIPAASARKTPRVYEVDPLGDPRWSELLRRHPCASVFHSRGWLEALHRTYGHRPVVLTTSEPNSNLSNGLVFCRVRSWLTGRRLVSLPFSDHCDPLVDNVEDLLRLTSKLEEQSKAEGCKYIEIRSKPTLIATQSGLQPYQDFYHHRLDLRPGVAEVFRRLHRNCIQRKIQRAERAGITITEGRDSEILRIFYGLVLQTRRRQRLPPQSVAWFRNLMACLGESAMIRCAWSKGQPIAAIFTLAHKKALYYKYGASDARFHNLGAMPYLFWRAIEDAISLGFEELDMGRSEPSNVGLVAFKERWGAARSALCYWRLSAGSVVPVSNNGWSRQLAKRVFSHIPGRCLAAAGKFLYPHID
jgi:GNAT acetyltransferase-like protein